MTNLQSILPEDKPNKPVLEPHNFFLFGAPMAGKSYFASFFPHPLSLNTDGNAEQSSTPAVQIRNTFNTDGSLKQNAISQLSEIILALNQPNVTFKTVIVDVPKNTFVYLVLGCADSPSNISGITTADTTINCEQFDFDLFNDFQTAFTAYADADFTFEVSRGGVS